MGYTDNTIFAYTDGACVVQTRTGGWGFVLTRKDSESKSNKRHEGAGLAKNTTANQMEMTAAINALQIVKKNHANKPVVLTTDTQYLHKGMTEWTKSWKANGWKKSNRKPPENVELWVELDKLDQELNVTWKWVKGSEAHSESERASILAANAVQQAKAV
jgi:ribonuclease HI